MAFVLNPAMVLHADDGHPEFDWEKVPLYAHVGLGRGLNPEEYQFLAEHYYFIAFTGGRVDREYRTNRDVTFERIVSGASKTVKQQKHCYFCYTWGWLPEHGALDWYPEFDKPLGSPKGSAVRDGWTFRRDFEHASVFVDIEKRVGKINWK